jgi:hypothetical protein
MRNRLPEILTDVQIEGDSLVFYFREKPDERNVGESSKKPNIKMRKRRRIRRRRNRMKTRGWRVVAHIQNSKGQKCAIYEPFIDALKQPLPYEEQKLLVAKILRSNGNRPSESSIRYFLDNTLEYLKAKEVQS